jgi:2-polyprenyl-6-hydroxyphenyl methylase/3-demethylubiquinone-9 3-methyltransferase
MFTVYFSTSDNSEIQNKVFKILFFDVENIHNIENDKRDDENFSFGENWVNFVNNNLTDEVIKSSEKDINEWLNVKGKTIIDIGCGSGLSSLIFSKKKAKKIFSFDYDIQSVNAAKLLKDKLTSDDNWTIEQGSILDKDYVKSLGKFDIVFSWGVLHHTSNMWQAIENAVSLCNNTGQVMITLYSNVIGFENDLAGKIKYNNSDILSKKKMIADFVMLVKQNASNNTEIVNWNTPSKRGMNKYNDIIDWLGGYPYEVCTTTQITEYMSIHGFRLLKKLDDPNKAVHEWLFQKL